MPRTIQSGPKRRSGKTGKGNPYLKRVLGEAAAAAAKTDTFLGERYRRNVRRRGKLTAVIVRMRFHQATIAYVTRRSAEGRTKREIIRCLKRYLAREIYNHVKADNAALQPIT